jgi:hypothetical protein
VFVRVSHKEYFRVLQTSSVLNYICFGGQATVIPDQHIEMVKNILSEELECEMANQSLMVRMERSSFRKVGMYSQVKE